MSPRPLADPTVGERIRARRLLRGWSIRYAASRAGISHATWGRIERGLQAANNRFVLADIAEALECSSGDLAGIAVPGTDRAAAATRAGVQALRTALIDIDLSEPGAGEAPPMAELDRVLSLVDTLRQACDYAGTMRLLPGLLRHLHAETAGPDRRRALRLLCEAAFIASSVLRNLGHPGDAWLGAERCRDAARATDDPVLLAYAAYALATAATASGSYQRGQTLAERAADGLRRHLSRPGGSEILGSLLLISAKAARGRGHPEDSESWLAEARSLARRTGETTTMGLFFGPTNVDIWQISIEVNAGDHALAAEVARQASPTVIAAGFRQVFYYADTARALARIPGREREAVRYLLTAERIAPQHVHTTADLRLTMQALLEQTGASELRGLSERLWTP
ncbi:helix-turn-helix domain-containing protein [Actinoplanes sp. NPDC048988]|uniref:helix-turn-helix domain-containing protein n=1 Tax=Actinoplanes sp. NPDC048988 TaxID=3363901 RepID=UPI00371E96ED